MEGVQCACAVLQQATLCVDDMDEQDVVSSDARLARIMQERERLDAMMRREQKRIRRTQRDLQLREQQRALVSCGALFFRQCPTQKPKQSLNYCTHFNVNSGDVWLSR